jgi:hypothetical protein
VQRRQHVRLVGEVARSKLRSDASYLGAEEFEQSGGGFGGLLAAAQQHAAVDGANLAAERASNDTAAAGDSAGRMQRNDGDAEPGFDHAHNEIGVGGLDLDMWRETKALEGFGDVLTAGGAAFVHDEGERHDVGQPDGFAVGERMARGSDQAPMHGEQVAIFELGGRFVRGGDAERELQRVEEGGFDFVLGAGTEADVDLRKGAMEAADGVDQDIGDQVLAGDDLQFAGAAVVAKEGAKVRGAIEEGLGMRQELIALWRERGAAALAADFLVKLDAEAAFQGEQATAESLLGDEQRFRCGAEAALAGDFDEGRQLVGRERRQGFGRGQSRFAQWNL